MLEWLKGLLWKLIGKEPPQLPPMQIDAFRDSIIEIYRELNLKRNPPITEETIDRIITKVIPEQYASHSKLQHDDAILSAGDCGGDNNHLKRVFPLLRDKLATLGITDVRMSGASFICIKITALDSIAQQWIEEINQRDNDFTNLHQEGIYR